MKRAAKYTVIILLILKAVIDIVEQNIDKIWPDTAKITTSTGEK